MPRNPIDLSTTYDARVQRRLAEAHDLKEPAFKRSGGGPAGAEGPAGEDGATWLSGTTVPSTGLGEVGDFYFRTTTSDVYKKTGEAVWSFQVNIKGETGATGATGAGGPEGPAGSIENTDWKNSVRAATTANITTSTALNPGDSLDGVTLAENDRVLVKDQTTKSQNGIWVVKAVPTRALDADAAAELSGGSTIYVEEGTRNKRRTFQVITPGNITPGTTAHEYQQIGFRDFGLVAALPSSEAVKNDKCTYIASEADGVVWDLIYSGTGTKWFKIGGPPLVDQDDTARTTNSGTYVSLTEPLVITAPLAGTYDICNEATLATAAAGEQPRLSYAVGATVASDEWAATNFTSNESITATHGASKRHTGVAKSAVIEEKARRVFSTTVTISRRRLWVDPVWVE